MKRLIATGTAGAIALALVAGVASAEAAKIPSEVKIEGWGGLAGSDVRAWGTISSPKRKCRVGRKVVHFEQRPGTDKRIGFTFGDSFSNWTLQYPAFAFETGVLYATVPRQKLRNGDICKAAKSSTFVLP